MPVFAVRNAAYCRAKSIVLQRENMVFGKPLAARGANIIGKLFAQPFFCTNFAVVRQLAATPGESLGRLGDASATAG